MSWGVTAFGGPGELPTKVVHPEVTMTPEQNESEKKTNKILAPESFGWRFFSAAFGVVATYALFLFVSSLFRNKWVGVLSSFLFTFDLLPLVQSRTAMNDIFAVTFILFAFYFFTKRKHLLDYHLNPAYWLLTGLFLGCAIASKWTALFTIGILGFYQFASLSYCLLRREHLQASLTWVRGLGLLLKQAVAGIFCLLLIPYLVYMLSYWQLFTVPIYDYKGNSLAEALTTEAWQNEKTTLLQEVKNSPTSENKKKLSETERKIAFWSWLNKSNPGFADRYFIWWGLQKQMWWYHTNLNATHAYTSLWWTWPLDIRPVWFYVKYCTNPADRSDPMCARTYDSTGGAKTIGDIYTMGNPLIFWLILPTIGVLAYYMSGKYRIWFYSIVPASILIFIEYALRSTHDANPSSMSEQFAKELQVVVPQIILFSMILALFLIVVQMIDGFMSKKSTEEPIPKSVWDHLVDHKDALAVTLCFLAFCGYWLPWARSPRIMFFYHFFPPVTFFYPLLAYCLYRVARYSENGKKIVVGYCLVIVLSFAYFYPHVTGWQVPEIQRENLEILKSWK
jgi:dolichyl-phosphate-mannose--protein O-mannosyl transferase